LLGTPDRTQGCELQVTQELIANSIGVRREGITYARGYIRVLDRKDLKDRVCECYSIVAKEHSRLLRDRASM
jgi:hypothetical protein